MNCKFEIETCYVIPVKHMIDTDRLGRKPVWGKSVCNRNPNRFEELECETG